jgi:hypothetical protein
MALRVYFERPKTVTEVDGAVEWLGPPLAAKYEPRPMRFADSRAGAWKASVG